MQNDRQAEFLNLREKVMKLWEELEMEPVKEFEQQVASGDIRVFVLSQQNLTQLNKFYAEVLVQFVCVACVQVRIQLQPSKVTLGT